MASDVQPDALPDGVSFRYPGSACAGFCGEHHRHPWRAALTSRGPIMTYDLFVSYAHADDADGWVTFLRDALVADHARYRSGEVLDPFFDTQSLREMDDWEHHILRE